MPGTNAFDDWYSGYNYDPNRRTPLPSEASGEGGVKG
jgi:hypothetical protein